MHSNLRGSSVSLAHLFSGNTAIDEPVGLAWIDTACRSDGYDVGISTPYQHDILLAAHEIAHNLGLGHVGGSNNLLSETGSSTALTNSQISTINNSFLSQPVSTSATLVTLDPATGEVLPQDGGGCGGCGVCAACAGV